jgi:ABC-type antimicrobial peptide transport system permease subunit
MVLREALVTVAAGGVVGVAIAMLTARIVASLLFGLKPQDPTTIVVSV